MPDSFYEGDLHVLEIERKLRKEAHKKLDTLEKELEKVQQKVHDARERFPSNSEQSPSSNSCSGDDSKRSNA